MKNTVKIAYLSLLIFFTFSTFNYLHAQNEVPFRINVQDHCQPSPPACTPYQLVIRIVMYDNCGNYGWQYYNVNVGVELLMYKYPIANFSNSNCTPYTFVDICLDKYDCAGNPICTQVCLNTFTVDINGPWEQVITLY